MTATTDPQDELFDILDAAGNPTGMAKPRGEVHRDGDWHRGLHVWVYGHGAGGHPRVLFQRRSMSKDTWPGALDVTVGGHFRSGETLAETLRETEEEIGLKAGVNDLILLGRRFIEDFGHGYIDRELDEVYALRSDDPLTTYRLHPDEVDGIVAIALDKLQALFWERVDVVEADEVRRDGSEHRLLVRLSDFAGDRRDYRQAAVAGIAAIVCGRRPEPFMIRS